MELTKAIERADKFIAGEKLKFAEADDIWTALKAGDELSLAREVLERMREKSQSLTEVIPSKSKNKLCCQHALLTSKDLGIEAFLVGSPRQPIHSGCGILLELEERRLEVFRADVV